MKGRGGRREGRWKEESEEGREEGSQEEGWGRGDGVLNILDTETLLPLPL